jgi:hypothetical protein
LKEHFFMKKPTRFYQPDWVFKIRKPIAPGFDILRKRLLPAIAGGGRIIQGRRGESHADIKHRNPGTDNFERGYHDPLTGTFHLRSVLGIDSSELIDT